MAIVALLALAQQLKAQTKYDFAIAGTWVTSENCNDLTVIPGVEGSVKYDAENKTLFLKNAKIDGGNANAIYSTLEGLTIRVAGKNQMRSDFTSTIQFTQPMQIAGSGTLNVENTQGDAIYANATSLIIDACTLNARGLNYGIVGEDGKNNEKLTIKYATVTAEGKNIASIGCFKYLTLMGCKISQPTDADFDEELGGIGKDGKLLKRTYNHYTHNIPNMDCRKAYNTGQLQRPYNHSRCRRHRKVRPCNTHTYIRECQYKHKRTLWNTKFHGQRNYSARWN